jgi:cytoskeletal protein CcmA (bactofilin family)
MTVSLFRRLAMIVLACAIAVPGAFARTSTSEITQFGHDIRVAEDQRVGDVTCFNCSVYVRGQVAGEITTFHGNVVIEENGMAGGEVTAFFGDVRLENEAKIAGEVTVFGGKVRRPPTANIAGDVTVFQGATWVILLLVSPCLVLAAIIALIIWLVRRRRPATALARAA